MRSVTCVIRGCGDWGSVIFASVRLLVVKRSRFDHYVVDQARSANLGRKRDQ